MVSKLGDMHAMNREFLEATMAVCALVAFADKDVSGVELREISSSITRQRAFENFDLQMVKAHFEEYILKLRSDPKKTKTFLYAKACAFSGDSRKARALMQLAYRISASDQDVSHEERRVIQELCAKMNLDADDIMRT